MGPWDPDQYAQAAAAPRLAGSSPPAKSMGLALNLACQLGPAVSTPIPPWGIRAKPAPIAPAPRADQ